ncbi:MAG: trigger factor [Thermoanaerobaculia bacterium]|nr:trigger factor [Thermoanaerobaculia bacterium]
MNITSYVEESPTKRTLSLEIPLEEVLEATEKAAKSLARQVRLPGFRPGKVPAAIVKKRFADELKSEVLESLLRESLREAFREKGISPVGEPKIDDLKYEADAPLTFKVEVEHRPAVTPKDYRGLKVPTEPTDPKEEEISAALERIREGRASFEPIEDRPAADGDFALVDIKGVCPAGDGKDFERPKVLVEIGGEETLPEMSAHLRNAEPGVTVSFQKDFPQEGVDADFAGKSVLYHVQLHALKKRVLPEWDDELARQVLTPRQGEAPEGAGMEMLRAELVRGMTREKEQALKEKRRRAVLDALLALNPVDAPETMVTAEVDSSLQQYARFLASQGMDLKEAKLDWNKLREEARPAAVRRVKEYLLLDAIADAEGLDVSETELDADLKRRARSMGASFSELKGQLAKNDRLDGIREELRIDKALELLLTEAGAAS